MAKIKLLVDTDIFIDALKEIKPDTLIYLYWSLTCLISIPLFLLLKGFLMFMVLFDFTSVLC